MFKKILFQLLLIGNILWPAQGEIWIRVIDSQGDFIPNVTIDLYNENGLLYQSGLTTAQAGDGGGNAWAWFEGEEPASQVDPTFGPLYFETTYYFVINNDYIKIAIGAHEGTPDVTITYNGSFSFQNYGHTTVTNEGTGDWNSKSITLKNSFNGGYIKFLNINKSSGSVVCLGTPTFPHSFTAIDNQYDGLSYKQKYQNWTTTSGGNTTNLTISVSAQTATLTANFLRECNISFRNKHNGGEVGGPIIIDDISKTSPTAIIQKLENENTKGKAVDHSLNHIWYTFTGWSEQGGTNREYDYFSQSVHKTYEANFTGKPTNGYRNQSFNPKVVGQPIKVYWDQHPNENVTQYKVWRKSKYGSAVCVKTVTRTGGTSHVYTYTDPMYSHTNSTSTTNLLSYDVRAYYQPDNAYSNEDWKSVYGEELFKQNEDNELQISEIKDYNISNYPNPFNPVTKIEFSIPFNGFTNLEIYNSIGELVTTLVNKQLSPGKYTANFNGTSLTSGVYFYKLTSGNFVQTKKMLLIK